MTSREETFSGRAAKGKVVSSAQREAFPLTIANGGSVTEVVDLKGSTPVAVYVVSAAWTAANIHFEVSMDGTNFLTLKDAANAFVALAPPVGGAVVLAVDVTKVRGMRYVRLRSANASTGASVNQAAARDLVLVTQP